METNQPEPIMNNQKKWRFAKRTLIIFVVLLIVLTAVNLSPLSIRELNNAFFSLFIHDDREKIVSVEISEETVLGDYTEPMQIKISKIGVDIVVKNPTSTEVKVLNAALLNGAVRYPGSGDLESKRNMFIFGHSSYLPIIHNPAFKAFNGIQNLKEGDLVEVYGGKKVYRYSVESVMKTTADDGFIDVGNFERKLILSTCDTFGKKQDRFIVTARFIEAMPQ